MSTYYGYRCKQDGAESDQWFNHGEHVLRIAAKCWPAVKQVLEQSELCDEYSYIQVKLGASHQAESDEIWSWLKEHYEHGIEIYNENRRSFPIEEGKHE